MADTSVISQVKALNTYEKLLADPRLGPKIRNIYPLTGKAGETRKKVKRLGKGAFGRVNLEQLNEGNVATKYFLNPKDNLCENIAEIAALRYLQGEPNVAQLIRVDPKPVSLPVNVVAPSIVQNLPFPAIVMGKAIGTLDDNRLFTSWDDVYSAIKQILLGYYTLHTRGIVHRDTKPHNMLMTSLGEVWISDFGTSKYTDKNIPITNDSYTGTYAYAAPELLIRHELGIPHKDYIQSDTWAVGASILHVLRGRMPFKGGDIYEILDYIFTVKGTPDATDGDFFTLYNEYSTRIQSFPTYAKYDLAIQERITTFSIYKPSDPAILTQIAEIVNGLLEYDSTKRMTIPEALQRPVFGGSLPIVPPRKSIVNQYIHTDTLPPIITRKILHEFFSLVLQTLYQNSANIESLPYVLDRTGIYIFSFIRRYADHPYMKLENLQLIFLVGLLIASCLFDIDDSTMFSIEDIKDLGYSSSQILQCVRLYMVADIQFYGRTLLDEMIQSLPSPTKTDIESLGYFNYTSFSSNVFTSPKVSLENLKQTLLTMQLPRKNYFTDKEPINAPPVPGGRRRTKKQKRGKTRSSKKTQYNRHGRIE
jgi:serine/threonine protein kinase